MAIAFILINCEMGNELKIIPNLKEYCTEVNGTYGIYDFICKLNYDSMNTFEDSLRFGIIFNSFPISQFIKINAIAILFTT